MCSMIRIVQQKDAMGMYEWMHDMDIMQSFRFDGMNMTREDINQFIECAKEDAKKGKNYHFAFVDENDEYWGTVSLKNIDMIAKNAEYAVCFRKKAHGTGMAAQATGEILDYAFYNLGLDRVYLNVLSENIRAVKLYEKLGFQYEGEWRNHIYHQGKVKALRWYGMLKEEWHKGEDYGKNHAK